MKTILIFSLLLISFNMYAQTSDTIYIPVEGVKLHAVLTKPQNSGNCPLAIIIAGSGPTDMNGNPPNMPNNSLRYLSDALVKNNIATLRFDKRGIGKSTDSKLKEAGITIDNYANDVVSIIRYFQNKGYKSIFIVGHSEGAFLGLIALQNIQVKGFVSISGPGSSADQILKKQLKPQFSPDYFPQIALMIDSLKNKQFVKNVPKQLNSVFRPSVQPYLISWFQYDPAQLIEKLNCPILILHGDKDLQLGVDEADKLAKASKSGTLLVIANMNHILKTIVGSDIQENYASYSNPVLPVHPDLVKSIVDFINTK